MFNKMLSVLLLCLLFYTNTTFGHSKPFSMNDIITFRIYSFVENTYFVNAKYHGEKVDRRRQIRKLETHINLNLSERLKYFIVIDFKDKLYLKENYYNILYSDSFIFRFGLYKPNMNFENSFNLRNRIFFENSLIKHDPAHTHSGFGLIYNRKNIYKFHFTIALPCIYKTFITRKEDPNQYSDAFSYYSRMYVHLKFFDNNITHLGLNTRLVRNRFFEDKFAYRFYFYDSSSFHGFREYISSNRFDLKKFHSYGIELFSSYKYFAILAEFNKINSYWSQRPRETYISAYAQASVLLFTRKWYFYNFNEGCIMYSDDDSYFEIAFRISYTKLENREPRRMAACYHNDGRKLSYEFSFDWNVNMHFAIQAVINYENRFYRNGRIKRSSGFGIRFKFLS